MPLQHPLVILLLLCSEAFACGGDGPDPEASLKPDYLSYLSNGSKGTINKYVDTSTGNDFKLVFPESELKKTIINELKSSIPTGVYLLAANYDASTNSIGLVTANFGCNHTSSHMHRLQASALFSNITLTGVSEFKEFGYGNKSFIQMNLSQIRESNL